MSDNELKQEDKISNFAKHVLGNNMLRLLEKHGDTEFTEKYNRNKQ